METFEEYDMPIHEEIQVKLETLEGTENMSIHKEIQVKRETFEDTDMSILEEIKVKQEPFEDTEMSILEEINVKHEPFDETEIQPVSIIEVEESHIKKELIDSTEEPLFNNITLDTKRKVNSENEFQESSTTKYHLNNKDSRINLQRHGFIPKTESTQEHQQDRRVSVEEQKKQQLVLKSPQHHCMHCGSGFVRKSNLTHHLQREMCTQKHQTCLTCQKVFTSQESLDTHMLAHTNCDICGQEFGDSNKLEVHKKDQHTKLKHQCSHPDCNKENCTFSQESYPSGSTVDKRQSVEEIQKRRAEYMRKYMRNFRLRKKRELEKKCFFQEKLKQQIKNKASGVHATTSSVSVSPEGIQQQPTVTTTDRSRNYQKGSYKIPIKTGSLDHIDVIHKITPASSAAEQIQKEKMADKKTRITNKKKISRRIQATFYNSES